VPDPDSPSRALVLGGGGVVGIAWETGLLAGLADVGVDLLDADLVVGTSAGATVAAQVTSDVGLLKLYADQLDPAASSEPTVDVDVAALRARIVEIMGLDEPADAVRRRIGALALAGDRVPEPERRAIIEARLPSHQWPDQLLRLTAIDAASGEFVVFDQSSGVPLVDAVAASCAIPVVWPAVTIGRRRYIDGGMRSGVNADVARNYGRVLVIEPLTLPETADVEPLGADTQSLVVRVDEASVAAMGANPLDPAARPASARAGYEQAARMAAEIGAFWNGGR
jgi:NTE family protein